MVKKFNELNESNLNNDKFKDIIRYKSFLEKMDITLDKLMGGTEGINIILNVGDDKLMIDSNADNWDIVVSFVDNLIKEDEFYDDWVEFNKNLDKFNI